jgi:hypothetical protein
MKIKKLFENNQIELQQKVSIFVREIIQQYHPEKFCLKVFSKDTVKLTMIKCGKLGVAPFIMRKLCDWADKNQVELILDPDPSFGSDYNKLVQFYEFYGFNEGLDGMGRNPK